MKPLKSLLILLFNPRTALALVVCTIFLTALRIFGVRLETIHLIGFPFLLLGISVLPKIKALRIPKALLLVVILLWFVGALDTRGVTTGLFRPATIYLARLQSDKFGGQTRQFLNTYRETVSQNSAISLEIVQRPFESPRDAQLWLRSRPAVRALVIGGPTFVQIVPNVHAFSELLLKQRFAGHSSDTRGMPAQRSDALVLTTGIEVARIRGTNVPGPQLEWIVLPESLTMPIAPPALAATYLSKIVAGIDAAFQEGVNSERAARYFRAAQSDALRFRNPAARMSAKLLQSSFTALAYLESHPEGTHGRSRGIKGFRRELELLSKRLDRRTSPQLAAAVFNNLAVLRLLERRDPRMEARALRELELAGSLRLRSGASVEGSSVARRNIELLKKDRTSEVQ